MPKRKASKKSTKTAQPVQTVGLDIGYGVTKVVTDATALTFPSVMGHAHEIKFQQETIQGKYPGDQIADDDGEWFVGDLAMAQVPAGELLRLRGRTANEKTMGNAFRLRLAKVAVGNWYPGCGSGMWCICGWRSACRSITCATPTTSRPPCSVST